MKVLFCGGGTGGHITPALAMADILKQNDKKAVFAFVGREGGRENTAITKEGYQLFELKVKGIRRTLSVKNLCAIYQALTATARAKKIIRDFKPDIVIGTGGYVSFPVLRAAIKMKLPTLLHESNSYPGLVTRLLGKRCDRVLVSSERAKKHLKYSHNTAVTGNPVRASFKSIDRRSARERLGIPERDFFVLSFGGSLGAEKLNAAVAEYMRNQLKSRGLTYVHATGRAGFSEYEELSRELRDKNPRLRIIPYIDDMPRYLSGCDIVISRSGAMTLAEIGEVCVPAVLIPSPYVADNHQLENARALADEGCAVILEESELTPSTLDSAISRLRAERGVREEITAKLKSKKSASCEKKIYEEIMNTASRTKKR